MKLSIEQVELASQLTNLQRKTVLNIISGMSNRQAYIKAGCKAKSEKSQDVAVHQMLSNLKVKAFYESVKKTAAIETTSKAILTRAEALELLTANARVSDEKRDQHQAIKQLSSMEGWDAPKKFAGPDGGNIKIDNNVTSPEIEKAVSSLVEKL